MIRACLLAFLLTAPCAAFAEEQTPPARSPLPAANNAFAWDLYDVVRKGDDNVFFSPYSVTTALAMTRAGARGATAAAMDKVLHLGPGVTPSAGFQGLVRALEPPMVRDGIGRDAKQVPAYALEVANALWGQRGYVFEEPFTKMLDQAYGAPLQRVNFNDTDGARQIINAWVEEHTREKIKDIVPEGMPSPLTRLVLANAIYYKAPWAKPFRKRATQEGDFTAPGGRIVRAPFMRAVHRYRHADLGTAWALEMPYKGQRTSMILVLPKKTDGLDAVEQQLVATKPADWQSRLQFQRVDLQLPKFKFTRALDLTSTLQRMGMDIAFDASRADFSGMTKQEKLFIGAVLHKAFVAIDEEGTEAAAATVVMMRGRSMPSGKPIPFRADHPFLFLIRHIPTNTILFMGRVTDPSRI